MSKQNRKQFIASTVMAGAALVTASSFKTGTKKMLVHHVFFWLKNPSSKKDLNQLFTGLRTLKGIKTVKQMHIGVPAPTENRSVVDASYQASEIIFFENVAAQKTYQDDPIHKKFIANCSHLWSKVVVYDSMDV